MIPSSSHKNELVLHLSAALRTPDAQSTCFRVRFGWPGGVATRLTLREGTVGERGMCGRCSFLIAKRPLSGLAVRKRWRGGGAQGARAGPKRRALSGAAPPKRPAFAGHHQHRTSSGPHWSARRPESCNTQNALVVHLQSCWFRRAASWPLDLSAVGLLARVRADLPHTTRLPLRCINVINSCSVFADRMRVACSTSKAPIGRLCFVPCARPCLRACSPYILFSHPRYF